MRSESFDVPLDVLSARRKRLRRIEIALWTMGLILLTAYGTVRTWSAYARDAGMAAFQQVRAELDSAHQSAQTSLPQSSPPDTPLSQPDTSLWSPQRLAAYRDSLLGKQVPEAVLRIPSLKLAVPIFDGTSEANLNRGAGRIEGTARIGEQGNVGVAGHRDGFFRVLKDARVGDALYLETRSDTLTYRIASIDIVLPDEVDVLYATSRQSITLVTCYPFYFVGSAPKRFIVHAERIETSPAQSSPAVSSDVKHGKSASNDTRRLAAKLPLAAT